MNDSLPGEPAVPSRWLWQRGGWLLVDRMTGHISAITLPEFDSCYSVASWYRDYVAYCGVSDDDKTLYAVVFLLNKPRGETAEDNMSDSECPAPAWERRPARVTFEADEDHMLTYSVRGHAADLVDSDNDEEERESFQVGKNLVVRTVWGGHSLRLRSGQACPPFVELNPPRISSHWLQTARAGTGRAKPTSKAADKPALSEVEGSVRPTHAASALTSA